MKAPPAGGPPLLVSARTKVGSEVANTTARSGPIWRHMSIRATSGRLGISEQAGASVQSIPFGVALARQGPAPGLVPARAGLGCGPSTHLFAEPRQGPTPEQRLA